jgi:uncharacterized protein (DUF983 family)
MENDITQYVVIACLIVGAIVVLSFVLQALNVLLHLLIWAAPLIVVGAIGYYLIKKYGEK